MPISVGSGPVSLLEEKSRLVSFCRRRTSEEIPPVSWLLLKYKSVSPVSMYSDVGMAPFKRLFNTDKY